MKHKQMTKEELRPYYNEYLLRYRQENKEKVKEYNKRYHDNKIISDKRIKVLPVSKTKNKIISESTKLDIGL